MIIRGEAMTPREREEYEQHKTITEMQLAHAKEIKQMEIELARLETRFGSWLKIPITIIKLPVLVVMAVGYCIAVSRKVEPTENFWKLMR